MTDLNAEVQEWHTGIHMHGHGHDVKEQLEIVAGMPMMSRSSRISLQDAPVSTASAATEDEVHSGAHTARERWWVG